jgi:hypothetical protein
VATTPDLSNQVAGLLRLSGGEKIDIPMSAAGKEVVIVKLIADALAYGSTWGDVSEVLIGIREPKKAKRIAKRMARDAQRQLVKRETANG